jgi:hypothetical protein
MEGSKPLILAILYGDGGAQAPTKNETLTGPVKVDLSKTSHIGRRLYLPAGAWGCNWTKNQKAKMTQKSDGTLLFFFSESCPWTKRVNPEVDQLNVALSV